MHSVNTAALNLWMAENIYGSLNGNTCQVSQRDEKGLISGAVLGVKTKSTWEASWKVPWCNKNDKKTECMNC